MAKKMKNDQVMNLCTQAGDLAETARDLKEAVNRCQIDDIPRAYHHAKELLRASEDFTAAALALMAQHDLQTNKGS